MGHEEYQHTEGKVSDQGDYGKPEEESDELPESPAGFRVTTARLTSGIRSA